MTKKQDDNIGIFIEKHKRKSGSSPLSQGTTCIDVSHTVEDGLITYKGLPAPIVCDYLSREESKKHYETGTNFILVKLKW